MFIRNTECPKCKEKGNDKSGDNLGEYSDHFYCWSCGYYLNKNNWNNIKYKLDNIYSERKIELSSKQIKIPFHIDGIGEEALLWLSKYELNERDCIDYGIKWNPNTLQLLIFFNDKCCVIRNFNKKQRYEVLGKIGLDTRQINLEADKLILVEDRISSIKIHKAGYSSIPLFGSSLESKIIKYVSCKFGDICDIYLWLDPDKNHTINKLNKQLLLRYGIKSLISEYDPKYYSLDKIKEILK